MRPTPWLALFLIVVVLVVLSGAADADAAAPPGPSGKDPIAPAARVMLELELPDELRWYYQNDVGMLLVYAGGRLHRIDLLAEEPEVLEAIPFPALSTPRSVIPIVRTGLLLIPEAPAGMLSDQESSAESDVQRTSSSYAFDTIGGKLLWEAPPLPVPDVVFSFPNAGVAVGRSLQGKGGLAAVDLLTGDRTWDREIWARIIWSDGPYLRLVSGEQLLTLDASTGETVRSDELTLPKDTRIHAFPPEGVLIVWKNKDLDAFAMPPAPPAEAAPARLLWEFKAGGPMMDICINGGSCGIWRAAEDRLLVKSGVYEVVSLTTGRLVLKHKRGMFPVAPSVSPGGAFVAIAAKDGMRVHNGDSGEIEHTIEYPKGSAGMKTLRYIRWLDDDVVMTVFPDKKGNPRRMSAFSCRSGSLLWSFVLPDAADYALTSAQRAQLIGRIMATLVTAAVSANNPMSVGGMDYAVVYVPDFDVSNSLNAEGSVGGGAAGGETGGKSPFAKALDRHEESLRLASSFGSDRSYFVVGDGGKYDVLRIDLDDGDVDEIARYESERVHVIVPFASFQRALAVENDNRRLRLISLQESDQAR